MYNTKFKRVINLFKYGVESAVNEPELNNYICDKLGINVNQTVDLANVTALLTMMMKMGIVIGINNLAGGASRFYFTNPSIVNQTYRSIYNILLNSVSRDISRNR